MRKYFDKQEVERPRHADSAPNSDSHVSQIFGIAEVYCAGNTANTVGITRGAQSIVALSSSALFGERYAGGISKTVLHPVSPFAAILATALA